MQRSALPRIRCCAENAASAVRATLTSPSQGDVAARMRSTSAMPSVSHVYASGSPWRSRRPIPPSAPCSLCKTSAGVPRSSCWHAEARSRRHGGAVFRGRKPASPNDPRRRENLRPTPAQGPLARSESERTPHGAHAVSRAVAIYVPCTLPCRTGNARRAWRSKPAVVLRQRAGVTRGRGQPAPLPDQCTSTCRCLPA